MPDFNDDLRRNMARVKTSTHDSPQKFAFFSRGDKALLINPNAKSMAEAKKEIGGGPVITGTCFMADGAYVFETPGDPPGSLALGIKSCLSAHAGMSVKVETRKAGAEPEEDTESEDEEPRDVKDRKIKIAKRVKALQDRVAALSKSAPQKVIPIRIKITQAGAAFKSANLDEAELRLQEAEELL